MYISLTSHMCTFVTYLNSILYISLSLTCMPVCVSLSLFLRMCVPFFRICIHLSHVSSGIPTSNMHTSLSFSHYRCMCMYLSFPCAYLSYVSRASFLACVVSLAHVSISLSLSLAHTETHIYKKIKIK